MTVLTSLAKQTAGKTDSLSRDGETTQRFLFWNADWAFYEELCDRLSDRRVFVTYVKGRLELVTTSLLHEMIVGLLVLMIRVLAEETGTPIKGVGTVTLRRKDLDQGVEADSSFFTVNERRIRGKKVLDLLVDPPPDLAVEVEVTKRLGERRSIYRELGVPELWVYGAGGLIILVKHGDDYAAAARSPTFPQLPPHELFGFVAAGLIEDETTWLVAFRKRVREALASG